MIERSSTVQRNNEVFANEIDGEVVMMNIQTGKYYGLDDVGTRIWEMMKEEIQVQQIIRQLLKEYHVSEQECAQDVMQLLSDLEQNQLIRVVQ
mgnify:CR=1 FL=1